MSLSEKLLNVTPSAPVKADAAVSDRCVECVGLFFLNIVGKINCIIFVVRVYIGGQRFRIEVVEHVEFADATDYIFPAEHVARNRVEFAADDMVFGFGVAFYFDCVELELLTFGNVYHQIDGVGFDHPLFKFGAEREVATIEVE